MKEGRLPRHSARLGEVIYRLLIGRAEGKEMLLAVGVRGRLMLELISKELECEVMNGFHPSPDTIL
jgi:hypothetical protein